MRKIVATASIFLGLVGIFLFIFLKVQKPPLFKPISDSQISPTPTPLPLLKYSLYNLRSRIPRGSAITIGEQIESGENFSSSIFYFKTEGKTVSGLLNTPQAEGKYPVIVMLRGFVDPAVYETGTGTKRSGQELSKNGFITLSPDFLGYGSSASPSAFPIEERFETYTTVLDLLSSLRNLNEALLQGGLSHIEADIDSIGLWGHSNGGQIALTVLEATGKNYPTVLWAPVSKPFPYSILYYTDEFEDKGKALRRVLAEFEKNYDVEEFNPINYLSLIDAPISLHQGGQDEAVPKEWSDELYQKLREHGKEVVYYTYKGEDHNFNQGSWQTAISRSTKFYTPFYTPDVF